MQSPDKHNNPRQRNQHRNLGVFWLHFSYKYSNPRRRDKNRLYGILQLHFSYKRNYPRKRVEYRKACVFILHFPYKHNLQRNNGAMGRCCKTLFMGYKHKRLHNTLHRRRYNKKLKYFHFCQSFIRHDDLKTARKTRRFSVLSKNRTIPHSKSNLPIRKAKPRLKTSLKTKKFIQ